MASILSWGMLLVGLLAQFALYCGLASADALGPGWVKSALAVELSFWLVTICSLFVFVWLLERWGLQAEIWLVVVVGWCVAAAAAMIVVPGASYLFIVPLVLTAITMLGPALLLRKRGLPAALFVFAVAVGLIWLPLERMFYDAVGFRMILLLVVRASLVTTALFPVVMGTRARWTPFWATGLAILTFATSILSVIWN